MLLASQKEKKKVQSSFRNMRSMVWLTIVKCLTGMCVVTFIPILTTCKNQWSCRGIMSTNSSLAQILFTAST